MECIQAILGVDLDEALDWVCFIDFLELVVFLNIQQLYLHCSEEELNPKSSTAESEDLVDIHNSNAQNNTPTHSKVQPSRLQDQSRNPSESNNPIIDVVSTRLDGNSASVPSSIKSRILASYRDSYESGALDEEDPNIVYCNLRLRQDTLTLDVKSQETISKSRQLQKEIDAIKQDYLFNENEAMELYKQERSKLDKAILEAKLQSPTNDSLTARPKKVRTPPPTVDPKGDDGSDSDEGMLGLFDTAGATEVVLKGITFAFRDLETPKHWSGPMPKGLLRDFVVKSDKYAAITYTSLSTHSRAKRASVTVSWSTRKKEEWSMTDIACPNESQAEQYISLIALHSLAYPLTDGFATSSPASTSNATSFRLLHAVYRDLWEELENSRKLRCDHINRTVWDKLQIIVAGKADRDVKASGCTLPIYS